MNAFRALRRQAAKKRDAAIKLATREYEATLNKIADLEQRFTGDCPQVPRAKMSAESRERPDGEMTLAQAIQTVLRTHGPLRKVEICVHVLESGYQTTMARRLLSSYAGKLLQEKKHLFKCEAGKWTLVG
jgi:hypothetical protein